MTPPRPSKKHTVDELRTMLSSEGLETKGKRESLFRRMMNHLNRFRGASPSSGSTAGTNEKTEAVTVATPAEARAESAVQAPASAPVPAEAAPPSPAIISEKKRGKQPIRAFLCFDVEATCRGGKEFDWPNEIIEFPVVLLRWAEDVDEEALHEQAGPSNATSHSASASTSDKSRLVIVDKFHTYVRPTWSPQLSEFCTSFTGITQEMVDASPTFPEVLKMLEKWMDSHGLREIEDGKIVEGLVNAVWVTDGPWDLRDFIPKQLHITPCDPASPLYLRQPYLNLKQAFQTVLSEEYRRAAYAASHPNDPPNERSLSRITTGKLVGKGMQESYKGLGFYQTISGMIEKLGLGEFEGRQHCGLDDATNVARILQALVEKDILVEANGRLPPPRNSKKWPWMGKPGEVNWEEWMSDRKGPKVADGPGPGAAGEKTPGEGVKVGDGVEKTPAVRDKEVEVDEVVAKMEKVELGPAIQAQGEGVKA